MNAREFWTCTRVVWLSVRDCFVSALTFAAVQYWYVLHEKGFLFLPYPSLLSWELLLLIRQISNIFSKTACYSFLGGSFSRVSHQYLISPMQTRLRVVPLPLSPSCVSQKETVGKKKRPPSFWAVILFTRFSSRPPRRTREKKDYSQYRWKRVVGGCFFYLYCKSHALGCTMFTTDLTVFNFRLFVSSHPCV